MQRRDLLTTAPLGLLLAGLGEEASAKVTGTQGLTDAASFRLTEALDPEAAEEAYIPGRTLTASSVPYVYAFYDEAKRAFVNPMDIAPVLEMKSYTLTPTIYAFNIRKTDQSTFLKLKNQVQLSLNATAPLDATSQLTWLFMSAVDIFTAKDSERPDRLTRFLTDDKAGVPLVAQPKLTIVNGTVSLQVTAFGQKPDGFWTKFFSTVSGVLGSPVVTPVLKGFGIPGLATDALSFVDRALEVFTEREKLVRLWSTGALEFSTAKGVTSRFYLRPGLWITVDSEYAGKTEFLAGHTVDLRLQSFRLMDSKNQPADANYLVTDLKFT